MAWTTDACCDTHIRARIAGSPASAPGSAQRPVMAAAAAKPARSRSWTTGSTRSWARCTTAGTNRWDPQLPAACASVVLAST